MCRRTVVQYSVIRTIGHIRGINGPTNATRTCHDGFGRN
jgi:hypothetical protein